MRAILTSSADWDCFKIPILQEILKIQNRHQEEFCVFLEVIRLLHSVGRVKNKLQFRSSSQKHVSEQSKTEKSVHELCSRKIS